MGCGSSSEKSAGYRPGSAGANDVPAPDVAPRPQSGRSEPPSGAVEAVDARVERFDRRGTEPFEPFRTIRTIRILSK